MKFIFTLLLSSLFLSLSAQTNVRAWYAEGQVWVVWEAELPLPLTYAVYAKPTLFTNTADAIPIGRLFYWEYGAGALKEQVDTSATFRIPAEGGQGGTYQLAFNEALFVATPHQAGQLYFAVVANNETTVTAGENSTDAAVPFSYDPDDDPVECHLQAVFPSPFAPGFTCLAYMMWADGRQNQWENRPDFPVMANAARNGMPSLFMVSVPNGLDTTQAFPLTIWLHGGGGTARQSLAGSRQEVNIKPEQGILLSHNDDLLGWRDTIPPVPDQPSWHFGWRKNFNPFLPGNVPTQVDTVVNYTQRRYFWIDQWLMRHFNIDPARIHINGHSMGSAGATALAKCYPNHYASATPFNNGFGGPTNDINSSAYLGQPDLNYPTNLTNRNGETVRINSVFNLLDNCSPERDLPLFRSWHGKNDINGTMMWDAEVVENYRLADSLGMGMQLFWSERAHGIDTAPGLNDHWIQGTPPNQQTVVDNVSYEEAHFRSDVSFPAFFNHRLDPQNNDPGDGTIGTGPNGVGDDWGTWGGYHRWDLNAITDTPDEWSTLAWLEDDAVFDNDNCPVNSLTADLAIRRPQQFKPAAGSTVYWIVADLFTSSQGTATVQADDVVVVPQVEVFREMEVLIKVSTQPFTATEDGRPQGSPVRMQITPNPSGGEAVLAVFAEREMEAEVRVVSLAGEVFSFKTKLQAGENKVPLVDFEGLAAGFYFVKVNAGGHRFMEKWVKN